MMAKLSVPVAFGPEPGYLTFEHGTAFGIQLLHELPAEAANCPNINRDQEDHDH